MVFVPRGSHQDEAWHIGGIRAHKPSRQRKKELGDEIKRHLVTQQVTIRDAKSPGGHSQVPGIRIAQEIVAEDGP